MQLQFSNASGKQIRLCYQISITAVSMMLALSGLFFSSPIVKSDEKINASIDFTIFFEKPVLSENETMYTFSNVPFDNFYTEKNSYVIIVDKNGGSNYVTIQEAINNAPDMTTIFIKAGTYNEVIDIKKSINLIGEDNAIINPASGNNNYAIRIGASGTNLSKLSITNRGLGPYVSGIYIYASNTEISNCNIYDTPIGVTVWTSKNIIKNCNFWGCRDEGIALRGSKYSACNDNKIIKCIFHDNCDGMEPQYSSNNIITNCEFYENIHTGINAIAESNDKNTITSCTIYNNNANGIYLSSSSNNQMMDCSISNNKNGNIITTGNSYNNKIANINSYIPNIENTKNSNLNAISNIKIKNYIASLLPVNIVYNSYLNYVF